MTVQSPLLSMWVRRFESGDLRARRAMEFEEKPKPSPNNGDKERPRQIERYLGAEFDPEQPDEFADDSTKLPCVEGCGRQVWVQNKMVDAAKEMGAICDECALALAKKVEQMNRDQMLPVRLSSPQEKQISAAWAQIKDETAMRVRDQDVSMEDLVKIGRSSLNYISGFTEFMETVGKFTGWYQPQTLEKKRLCPKCFWSNPEKASFCMSCGERMAQVREARFELVHGAKEETDGKQ